MSHDNTMLFRAPVHHLPLDMYMFKGASTETHGTRVGVMCRPASPDPGAALHGTPLEHSMWQQAQPQRVEHRSALYLACTHTMTIIAVPPHLSLWSLQTRRGRCPRTPCRDLLARSAGGPRPVSHRAAPTYSPSSRTERDHSSRRRLKNSSLHCLQSNMHIPV
jgi:hypothetical protein